MPAVDLGIFILDTPGRGGGSREGFLSSPLIFLLFVVQVLFSLYFRLVPVELFLVFLAEFRRFVFTRFTVCFTAFIGTIIADFSLPLLRPLLEVIPWPPLPRPQD